MIKKWSVNCEKMTYYLMQLAFLLFYPLFAFFQHCRWVSTNKICTSNRVNLVKNNLLLTCCFSKEGKESVIDLPLTFCLFYSSKANGNKMNHFIVAEFYVKCRFVYSRNPRSQFRISALPFPGQPTFYQPYENCNSVQLFT